MSNSKTKFYHKLLAVALSVMMLIAMVPATVLTSAWGSTDPAYDYLSAQDFAADYAAKDDSIAVSWTAITGDVDSLSLTINGGEAVALDAAATTYTVSAADYAGKTIVIALTAVCDEEGRTVEASVAVPATLKSVLPATTKADNNASLDAILNSLPKQLPVMTADNAYVNVDVAWSPDGIHYNRDLTTEQVFTVAGYITLPATILNRNNVDLSTTIEVTVLAAEAVAIETDLDTTPINKLAGDSLKLSVKGVGTVMGYQWYRDGVAIDGATSSTLNIASLTPADAGSYYCQVKGKGSSVNSQTVTVAVAKRDTTVTITVDPENSQSRPAGVTLQATGIPAGATGTLTFMAGEDKIGEVTLPATSMEFHPTAEADNYDFYVIYSGDVRYNGSTSASTAYSFTKGTLFIAGINIEGGLAGKAGTGAQVLKPTVTPFPHSNVIVTYKYKVDNTEIAEVSDTGYVTYKKHGDCTLTITVSAGNDYNDASISIPIHVSQIANSNLAFTTGSGKATYAPNFSYSIPFVNGALGTGELSVKVEADFAEYLDVELNTEYNKVIITYKSDLDTSKNLTGPVKIILEKAGDDVYMPISAEHFLNINKGKQSPIRVEFENVNVVYGETGDLQAVLAGGSVAGDAIYSVDDSSIVTLLEGNRFKAMKPGTAVITVTKPGNGLYEEVKCHYAIIVAHAPMKDFGFVHSEITSHYGVKVENPAVGGIEGSPVTYAIQSADYGLDQYLIVNQKDGAITFNESAYLVADSDTYKVVITATKLGNDYYETAVATYTLTLIRKAIEQSDLALDGADYLSNGDIHSNFGNVDKTRTGVTITPANGFNAIFFNNDWHDSLLLQNSINADEDNAPFYLKKENGEISQSIYQKVIVDKQGPGSAGNVAISIGTNAYRDDAVNSVWSGFTGILSFDLFKESSKEVVVKAKDNLSDIKDISYYIQTEGFVNLDKAPADITLDDITPLVEGFDWVSCDMTKDMQYGYISRFTIDLPENSTKKVVIYVKVIDSANNVSYFRSAGIVFDNMAPSCDVEALPDSIINVTLPEVNGQVGLYNDDVKFDVTITDEAANGISAGIEKIEITVSGINGTTGEWLEKKTIITANRGEISAFRSKDLDLASVKDMFTVQGDFIIPASYDSNHLSILVKVWDFAGNFCSNEYNQTHLAIDSSAPAIDVYYQELFTDGNTQGGFNYDLKGDGDSKYLGMNQFRRATITIRERNFTPAGVDFSRLLLDGETLGVNPTFTCVAADYNGDSYEWVATIDFVKDGEYDFNVSCTDKAKNKNSEFTCADWTLNRNNWIIDNTKPVIHVAMSNNNVKNGSYFAALRVATITITERNFDKADKLFSNWDGIKINGSTFGAPKAKWVKSDANTYEHVYTITFAQDGDYDFNVAYTDLAGNVSTGYTCSAASHEHFTVDTTAPAISITGVAHQTAYNYDDVVSPVINYSDVNIDNTSAYVRLSGARNGNVQYQRVEQSSSIGKRIQYNDFSKVTYMDDIYTLSVSLADKAGNTSYRLVTFSVNRFGSNYDLSLVEDIIGKYLREEQDIVFSEINVNELDHETLLIKLIKDGSPTALVEGTDYTIDKVGGDGQWSVYTYTIKKDLFSNDGHYNISVYSEDGAGNANESEEKDAEISFAIDKTAPVIVPIDLEDDTPYATDSKKVSVEIKDNLLLDGVKILLNGKEVEYTADGDNYTFDIGESGDKQNVAIVAVDAAGNTLPVEVKDVLVNASFFVRWFNNTPVFIGSLVGVVLLVLILTALALFGKKKQKN